MKLINHMLDVKVQEGAENCSSLCNIQPMNCEHSQPLGCVCYCGPRSHCPTIVNDNVSGDECVRCV